MSMLPPKNLMILVSDRGPSRGRFSGSRPPKIRQSGSGRTPPPPPSGDGGEKKSWWACSIVLAVPATALLALSLLAAGVAR